MTKRPSTSKGDAAAPPPAPEHLTEPARLIWQELVAAFPAGVLAWLDHRQMGAYCEAAALHAVASQRVAEFGPVVVDPARELPVPSPWLKVVQDQAAIMARLGPQLGLCPAARKNSRTVAPAESDPQEERRTARLPAALRVVSGRKP